MERDATLPPPITLNIPADGNHVTLNLMPLSIEYSGTAPVDAYFVTRSISDTERESSFRGRRVHGTRIQLPGYSFGLYRMHESDKHEPAPKRMRVAQPSKPGPVRAKRFTLDDDDDEQREPQDTEPVKADEEEHAPIPAAQPTHELRADVVAGDSIWIWGPDGPIDRGGDAYIRTCTEWLGVLGPSVCALLLTRSMLLILTHECTCRN